MASAAVVAAAALEPGSDQHLSHFISLMDLCFLALGEPGTPVTVELPLLGRLSIWDFCCRNTSISGLDLRTDVAPASARPWTGEATITLGVREFAATCQSSYMFERHPGHEGKIHLTLGSDWTRLGNFVDILVAFSGNPLSLGGGSYPFPGPVTRTTCRTGFVVSGLRFVGPDSEVLNVVGAAGELIEGLLRGLVCEAVDVDLPGALGGGLARARDHAEALARELPADLPPPAPPRRAGPAYDLRAARPLAFARDLLRQGLQTGELVRLLDRATNSTGTMTFSVDGGMRLFEADVGRPANMSMSAELQSGRFGDLRTIEGLSVVAQDVEEVAAVVTQSSLNVSTTFGVMSRLMSDVFGDDDADQRALPRQRIQDMLSERFRLRLVLADVRVDTRLGVRLDRGQVDLLTEGSSWYDKDCMMRMVQNASVMGFGVQVVVEQLALESTLDSSEPLEADIVRGVNGLLRYVNAPEMRPTVARLVRGAAAGPLRDLANERLQALLAESWGPPCSPEFGTGSQHVFGLACIAGAAALLLGLLRCLRRRPCLPGRPQDPRLGLARCCALAAICFIGGGLLGRPLRAALRLSSGQGDTLAYVYVVEVMDLVRNMPMFTAAVSLSTAFAFARAALALSAADARGRLVALRWAAAVGGWDRGLIYACVGTQITGFFSTVVEFGDASAALGAQFSSGFYAVCLGGCLNDLAALLVCRCKPAKPAAVPRPPTALALGCLAFSLALLLAAPWLALYRHDYTGTVNRMFHYESADGDVRFFSLARFLAESSGMLLNPFELGVGVYVVCIVTVLHIILAPLVHGAVALYIGMWRRRLSVTGGGDVPLAAGAIAGAALLDDDAVEAEAEEPCMPLERSVFVVARSLSGADAFAVLMLLCVPELGSELLMLSHQMCSIVAPMLQKLDAGCMTMSSEFFPGIAVLLLGGLGVRVFAELCARDAPRGFGAAAAGAAPPTA